MQPYGKSPPRKDHTLVPLAAALLLLLQASSSVAQGQDAPPPSAPAAAAASGNVTLKVREKGSGLPMRLVEIVITGNKTMTDPDGAARIDVPASGDGSVRFQRKGFQTLEVPFSELRPPGDFDIFLYPGTPSDDVIIVTGKRRPQVSRKTITVEESRKVAPGGDAVQVIKLLPGVQTQSFSPEVIVRGSGPEDSRYYIDDLEVPFIFHGIGNISVVPGAMVQDVEFDSGGFGPEKGDATGGMVVVRTKNEIPERPNTEFLVNIPLYSGIYHTRPLSQDSALTVSVRRSYLEYILQPIIDQQAKENGGQSLTLVPYFGDAHVVYLHKDESGSTKVSMIGAYDGIKAAIPSDSFSDETGRAEVSFRTSFVNLGVERQGRMTKDWRYTSTPQIYFLGTNANFVGNDIDLKVWNVRAPTEFTQRRSKTEDFYFGIDPSYVNARVDTYAIEFVTDDPAWDPEDADKVARSDRESFANIAAWTAIDQQVGPVILTPGVRGFYNGQIKKSSADPRLRARYLINDANTVKAAAGQYSQSPQPQEASKDFGNPDLDFIRSMHYVLGLETKWGDEWTTEVQAFYKTAADNVTGDVEKRFDNDASFRSRGAEIFIRRNPTGRVFGWLAYTYSKTEARDSDQDPFRESQYDQSHVVNLAGNYRFTGTWELGGRYNFHTGDTYTPVDDAVYNANLDRYQERKRDEDTNQRRLDNFNALTVYLGKDFLYDTWKLKLRAGLESYWPQKQTIGISNNYDFSKEEPNRGIPAIPFIEVRGEL